MPSIKDIKSESRGDENTEKQFPFGPRQRIPSDFNELLKISSFKRQFLRFLYKEYEDPVYGAILGKKVFYCAIGNECKKLYGEDGVVKFKEIYDLYGCYLEGDTNIMFHTKHADVIGPSKTVVRGGDTDIAIMLFVQCGGVRKQSLAVWS